MVEMFGLKKPLPTISRPNAAKKKVSFSTVINRWPAAINRPPSTTARRAPRT